MIIKLIVSNFTLLNVVKMQIKDVGEAGPKDIDRKFMKETIKNIHSVDPLHLFFTVFIDLNHNKDGVWVINAPLAILLDLIHIKFKKNLTENLVEHEYLLGCIGNFEIKEFENEQHLFGHSI